MRDILVFKTATDPVMNRLFHEIDNEKAVCLIQKSLKEKYQNEYIDIRFVSMNKEWFDDEYIIKHMSTIKRVKWRDVYICCSYENFGGYDNVLRIIDRLKYKRIIMYNCNGEKKEIKNSFKKRALNGF